MSWAIIVTAASAFASAAPAITAGAAVVGAGSLVYSSNKQRKQVKEGVQRQDEAAKALQQDQERERKFSAMRIQKARAPKVSDTPGAKIGGAGGATGQAGKTLLGM